jgi:hypothetical protein
VTINILPDDALLEIFDFYVGEPRTAWHTLVHVCQKWRNVVFGSPRRLNLRLYCTASTPVTEMLGVWPLLPIDISVNSNEMWDTWGEDNIIAALEHKDRICELGLPYIPSSKWEKILAAMQQPFPELTRLHLMFEDDTAPVIPSSFLGGSAPRLRSLSLFRVPLPGLPKLLLSATHLVQLILWGIPHSGYFSPEAMVTSLSVLTRLEGLTIMFGSQSRPQADWSPPPQTRILLPVLTNLLFKGVGKYLGDLVSWIDAPVLNKFHIIFLDPLEYDTQQLTQFINRTTNVKAHDEARVVLSNWHVSVELPQTLDGVLELGLLPRHLDSYWQLPSLAQVCSLSSLQAFIAPVENLYILEDVFLPLHWQDDIDNSQWLELFRPFTSVKGLYISQQFVPYIAPALQELVGERVTVFPTLQTIFLEEILPPGPAHEAIGQFVAARQLSGHPIVVSCWERKREFED